MSARSDGGLHIAWARLFLRAAASSGVTDVVLSPGSRSTPLAIAAATTSELRVHVVIDERTAGFFALGQARVTGRPSLLVCTSGTAAAHYFPAVIEAHESYLPLLVVTADRPWELKDAAAPQTIDQLKLFGSFARHFAELGLPDPSSTALTAVPRIAAQAVARALGPVPGPVHLNARFRKPLEPVATASPAPWEPLWQALMERGAPRVHPPVSSPDERAVAEIEARAARAERGLLVCGPAPRRSAAGREKILDLARATGFPLFAEGTSQARFGGDRRGVVSCSALDAILRAGELRRDRAPDLILELGAPPTSAGYAALLAANPRCPRFVIAPHGHQDPSGDATALILSDPAEVAGRVAARLSPRPRGAWAEAFTRADAAAWALADQATSGPGLSEGAIVRATLGACPEGSTLAIGNSTPVRDLDAYCPAGEREVLVLHQRGASGIDGLVSGAAGAESVSGGPMTLLLGDLSLLHDLTGLALARRAKGPLVIVAVANGGGRIFDHLPLAASAVPDGVFERCFATPEPVAFEHAAAAFGVPYARAETRDEIERALSTAHARPGATLIEAITPPGDGARRMAKLWADLRAEITKQEGAER